MWLRRGVIMGVGAVAKLWTSYLNRTTVINGGELLRAVLGRPRGVPLVTVSNHMSTMDDPLLWGFKSFPICDSAKARWVLAAEDICFRNPAYGRFFAAGKCLPVTRGGGIYQPHMDAAAEKLALGEWVHTFPEGKVSQEDAAPIRRLKWGTASLVVRSPVTPIVLPIVHHGFHTVMPEDYYYMFGRRRRPFVPLCNKEIRILVGSPIEFDLPAMKSDAVSEARGFRFRSPLLGWPSTSDGLDEAAQRCLYSAMSSKIRSVMEDLRIRSFITTEEGDRKREA